MHLDAICVNPEIDPAFPKFIEDSGGLGRTHPGRAINVSDEDFSALADRIASVASIAANLKIIDKKSFIPEGFTPKLEPKFSFIQRRQDVQ